MYNSAIRVANKIITYDDLFEIFVQMNEKLIYYKKINNMEEKKNHMLEYNYQNWSFKDNGSRLQFDVNFYDDTQVKFDNYNNFISVLNRRLEEIKLANKNQVFFDKSLKKFCKACYSIQKAN